MPRHTSKPHERIIEIKKRAEAGPAFLHYCIRPFFLGAGIWAMLALPLWMLDYSGYLSLFPEIDGLLWHQHEMLFGFTSAAIAGYMLTTIPNWTGQLPVSGWRLALFFGLWILGRIGMLSSPFIGMIYLSLLDLVFLTALSLIIAREIVSGKNWRNMPMLCLISVFTLGNWLVHAELNGVADTADLGLRLSLYILALLVAVIGGRIVPSFTRNWLVKQKSDIRPEPVGLYDKITLAVLGAFVVAHILFPAHLFASLLAILSGILNAVRLIRWKGWAVLSEPMMWAQHLGYAWLVIALFLIGLENQLDFIPASAATHALTTGAFGTMILAVMARASYTFTGRQLTATKGIVVIFYLINIAAILRVIAPFYTDQNMVIVWLASLFWILAYGLFVVIFLPILTTPRIKKHVS